MVLFGLYNTLLSFYIILWYIMNLYEFSNFKSFNLILCGYLF